MTCRYREELVGKRFISVRSPQKLKIQKISEWEWRSGVVRAVSSRDTNSPDLSVLIEFDDIDWTRREWVHVHYIFQLFLVEHTLVWAERPDPDKHRHSISWPGLSYRAIVDKAGLAVCKRKPVEFLVDRFLGLVEEKEIQIFQEGDESNHPTALSRKEVQQGLKEWLDYQDGQKILLTTPTVLVGYRLEVYRAEGTTQWYTAVIQSYNHTSKTLLVTDDTVLEEHNEDPTLTQMHLIDDGVVDSILRGVEIGGIAPRRRPRAVKQEKEQPTATSRASSLISSVSKSILSNPKNKSRTPQQSSVPVVSPALPSPVVTVQPSSDTEEGKGVDGKKVKLPNPKDRKRKLELNENSCVTLNSNRKKIKTEHEDNKIKRELKKLEPESTSEVPTSVRDSQRNTTDINTRQSRSRKRVREKDDGELDINPQSIESDISDIGSNKVDTKLKSVSKIKVRCHHKVESLESSSLKSESSGIQTNSSGDSSNLLQQVSLNQTPTEASSVIINRSNSGSSSSKRHKKPELRSDSAKCCSSDNKTSVGINKTDIQTTPESASSNRNKRLTGSGANCCNLLDEHTFKSSRSINKNKEKHSESVSKAGVNKKSPRALCSEKQNKLPNLNQNHGNSQEGFTKNQGSLNVVNECCREITCTDDWGDNMRFIKQKQSLLAVGISTPPQTISISVSNIDLNQSLTDQIAHADKLSSANGEEKSDSGSSTLSSPVCESYTKSPNDSLIHYKDTNKHIIDPHNTNKCTIGDQEEQPQSQNSDGRCSSGLSGDECRRPGSRVNDVKCSTKSILTSSPQVVGKSEPVHIYRDPELMSNNPVWSNIPNMHNSHKSYPQLHNPVPTQASRPPSLGMTSTSLTSALDRQSRTPVIPSVAYPPLLGASLSNLLPPGLHQLDPATLALHQQLSAVQQQQHVAAALASQYSNALSMSYSPHGNLNKSQLEHLWQQKYPTVPMPPPWMLAKHHENLLHEVRVLHEQEQLERERELDLREREQRERKDRERRERERIEKERLDRERFEREKVDLERAKREQLEREQQEKEQQEREHLERERSRVLKESVDSQAAVDQHFLESLRLASQRAAQTGMWPSPSITLGTGKAKGNGQQSVNTGDVILDEKIKQEQPGETDYRHLEMMRKHKELMTMQEEYIKQQMYHGQLPKEHCSDTKADMSQDIKPLNYLRSNKHEQSSSIAPAHVKLEPGASSAKFSLYGYQPEKYTFITTDLLNSFDLDKVKNEKFESHQGDCHSPRRKELSVPPPLIKDTKPHSSVIVENKVKDCSAKSSPLAHQQYPTHMSPHQQPKPAHTPDRPRSNSSSPGTHGLSPSVAHSQHVVLRAEHVRQITSRSQSPLRIASPQQLSAAVMQPMDYRCQKQNKSRGSPGSNIPAQSAECVSPAIAQPPVALPLSSVAYTYSLIQQGLVPNPIYTSNSTGKCSDSQRTVSVTGTAQVPRASQSPLQNYSDNQQNGQQSNAARTKRKGQNEGNSRKRQKVGDTSVTLQAINPLNLSVSCTTTQISANQSPYTTSSGTVPNFTNAIQSQGMSLASQQVGNNRSSGSGGFMDSFKSFVKSNAFMSDPELAKATEGQTKKPYGEQLNELQQQHLQQQKPLSQNWQLCQQLKSSLERSCSPVVSQQNIQSQKVEALSNASNSNSATSYLDSINRVANGQIDTDSDTLSAPSPPSHPKQDQTPSPHNAAKHPNLKKAWLQRHIYSDEDKQDITPPVDITVQTIVADGVHMNVHKLPDDLEKDFDKEQVKNCYVNCSYISPSYEGGSKSPISTIQASALPNGISEKMDTNDELTTSASETETQMSDSCSKKKWVKSKGEKLANPKKQKSDIQDATATNGQKKKTNHGRSKDHMPKNAADNMSKEQIKRIVENCKDSVKEKSLTKEAVSKSGEGMDIDELSNEKLDQDDIETSQSEDQVDTDSSSKKSDSKREKQTKKDTNIKREMEANYVYVQPPSILKQTEMKAQQNTFSKPLVKLPDSVLRKTCEPFLQDGSCSEVTPKLMKCRECKMTPTQRGKTVPNIFCRFYAFRRLKYSQRGFVTIDGFSELTDAEQEDIDPWIPKFPIIEPTMDVNTSRFIIRRLGDKFCELVQQEKKAQSCAGDKVKIAWKRAVTGVREMCDVCDTTLFNMHWVCHKCGFVVCLDCYNVKANNVCAIEVKGINSSSGYLEDQREWLTCSANRLPHEVDKMMLTQIIPADALWEVGRMVHEVRERWGISRTCPCTPKLESKKNGIKNELMQEAIKHISPKSILVNGVGSGDDAQTKNDISKNTVYNADSSSPLSLLADVASMDSEKVRERSESPIISKKNIKNDKLYTPITEPMSPGSSEKKICSTLRELLTKTAGGKVKNNELNKKKSKITTSLDDIIQKEVEKQIPKDSDKVVLADSNAEPMKLIHYTPRLGVSHMLVRETPIIAHNLTETSVLYPDVPHSWLCDGRLLRLIDSHHRGNMKIFMEQWRRGQPVVVSGVDKYINEDLWKPEFFSKHFGNLENDLINCRSSCVVVGQPMKHFWDGFACMEERLVDEEGTPMMLKLKDWPPGDDFSDVLPQQFHDLTQALPLPEYTRRDGRLNLVSRLPDFLVKPDLGPKMYIAYGSAQYPKEGTTNLHLDVSDAANLMVFVGFLEEEERGKIEKDQDMLKAMDMAHCDPITQRRVRDLHEVPGAIWHIFDACDADKIRDFLNKVGKERGEKIELHHDPIHDQSWYLDEELRDRLAREYGVLGYTIIQCLGDAIFIPAGAPHQVRNLNNCIKVAEDFVSPENVHHCFQLTQEFRHLSEGHSNHEDKLQIKNIVYHAVKDAIAILNEANPDDCDD